MFQNTFQAPIYRIIAPYFEFWRGVTFHLMRLLRLGDYVPCYCACEEEADSSLERDPVRTPVRIKYPSTCNLNCIWCVAEKPTGNENHIELWTSPPPLTVRTLIDLYQLSPLSNRKASSCIQVCAISLSSLAIWPSQLSCATRLTAACRLGMAISPVSTL
jgi:hypothetical protein